MAGLVLLCAACDPRFGKNEDIDRALERGRQYRSRHLYAKAEETFVGVLQRHPDHPDAARAHQELGYLYFEDLTDYVSALYHLERYLKVRPGSQPNDLRGDVLEQVRAICQQEIAKEVSLSVLTTALQREIRSLGETNKALRLQVANLSQRLAQIQATRPGLPADAGSDLPAVVPPRDGVGSAVTEAQPQAVLRSEPLREPSGQRALEQPAAAFSRPQTHTIRKGDTLFSLAARYRVSVPQLQRANPRVQPDNLQIGQQIVIPEP